MKKHIVILPSPLIYSASYAHVATLLARGSFVHVFDLPASGHNHSLLTWDEQTYSRWVRQHMKDLKIDKAIFLGHSNSGAVAIKFAAEYPECVEGLILADTIGVRKQSLLRTITGRFIDGIIERKWTIVASPHLLKNVTQYTGNFLKQVQLAAQSSLQRELGSLRMPVLVAWGMRDHTMPPKLVQDLSLMVQDAEYIFSDKGSHDWLLTEPSSFAGEVLAWISRQASASTNEA